MGLPSEQRNKIIFLTCFFVFYKEILTFLSIMWKCSKFTVINKNHIEKTF